VDPGDNYIVPENTAPANTIIELYRVLLNAESAIIILWKENRCVCAVSKGTTIAIR
jgi:hypothetical protein